MSRCKCFLVILLSCFPMLLQPFQRDLTVERVTKRVALVIGNNTYPGAPLKNAANDARAMGQTLQAIGFETEVLVDAGAAGMESAVNRLASRIGAGDVAVFYFAGHGVQIDGENYLVPTDFVGRDETDLKHRSLSAYWIQEKLDKTSAQLKILILDACRTNPFRVSRGGSAGLAQMQGGRGDFVAFATAAGKVANDSVQDSNGLFTKHLVTALQTQGLSLDEVFNKVRAEVDQESSGQQLPYVYSGVIGSFYFRPNGFPPDTKTSCDMGTDSLGTQWSVNEAAGPAAWTRRGNDGVFAGSFAGGSITAGIAISRSGNSVVAKRTNSSDGNDCTYSGLIDASGKNVSGTYSCTKMGRNIPWTATLGCSGCGANELGARWSVSERGNAATWTRRSGGSFTGLFIDGVTATVTINRNGNSVIAKRTGSSDGNDCTYTGRINASGRNVRGVFTCTRYATNAPWTATIFCQ